MEPRCHVGNTAEIFMRKATSGNGSQKGITPNPPIVVQELDTQKASETAEKSKAVEGPVAYASGSQISIMGNDAVLLFNRWRPAVHPHSVAVTGAMVETTAIIHVSMATLKDLSIALADAVGAFEKQFGEIQTDFTRRRAAGTQ